MRLRLSEAGELARELRALGPWTPVRAVVRIPELGIEVEDCFFELTESATEPQIVARVRAADLLGPAELAAVRGLLARHGAAEGGVRR